MNEFTKEELEKVDEILHWYWYAEKSEISISVQNKLESMIENYCEPLLVDDVIWAFDFPEDGCGGFDVSSVELIQHSKSKNAGSPFVKYAYATKEEAIQAMSERLKEIFRNE